jgi:hypothetical protein
MSQINDLFSWFEEIQRNVKNAVPGRGFPTHPEPKQEEPLKTQHTKHKQQNALKNSSHHLLPVLTYPYCNQWDPLLPNSSNVLTAAAPSIMRRTPHWRLFCVRVLQLTNSTTLESEGSSPHSQEPATVNKTKITLLLQTSSIKRNVKATPMLQYHSLYRRCKVKDTSITNSDLNQGEPETETDSWITDTLKIKQMSLFYYFHKRINVQYWKICKQSYCLTARTDGISCQ